MFKFLKELNRVASRCHSSHGRRFKLISRSIITTPWTKNWLFFLQEHLVAKEFFLDNPRLLEKIHRTYLRKNFSIGSRVEILRTHFELLHHYVPEPIWRSLAKNKTIELATLTGRDDFLYKLELKQTNFEKEGELSISLFDINNEIALATITFSLVGSREKPIISIGGLQGTPSSSSSEAIRIATKALHGLRPKQAVLFALIFVSQWFKSDLILATSNNNHMYRAWWRRAWWWKGKKIINADYDSFWIEQNASMCRRSGDFNINTSIKLRRPEEIPNRKRAEYARRYFVINQLQSDISQFLGDFK